MKIFLSVFCLFLFGSNVTALSGGKITGKVIDSATREAVEYATITVTDRVSHQAVNGALTDKKGAFEVSDLPQGSYMITIDFLGYQKKVIDSVSLSNTGNSYSLNTIALSAKGKSLRNVTVTASTPIIENKIDKMVYNAANDITAQGGTALDVLKKVPQVNVDVDGNVELQGNSDVRFLINGKPSSVFGNSVTDALATIPASQIKSIEVVTSPGAKYDAQGTGGIINIILKDNKMQGINGSITMSAGTRLENGSANLNIRENNIGFNIFFSGNAQLISRTPSSQDRKSYDSAKMTTNHLIQNSYTDFHRSGFQTGIGMDWNITKHDNITASLSFNKFSSTGQGVTNLQQDTAGSAAPPINSIRHAYNSFEMNSADWSMNYKKTFKKEDEELNILYNASYGMPVTYYSQQSSYLPYPDPYSGAISNNPGRDNENDIALDYTYPIAPHVSIETGAKTTFQNITSTANVNTFRLQSMDYLPDPGQSYSLKYDLQVYAAYASISFRIKKILKIKSGIRYEYTHTKIDYPNTYIPDYGTLAPSVVLSHDLKEGQFLKLSYSRRIERADYRDVNPFLNLADPNNITTGNPLLKPEIENHFEFGYNRAFGKSGNLYIALIERINTQDHKPVTIFYQAYKANDTVFYNVSVTNWQNTGTEYNTGINVSGSYTIKDKLSLRGNAFFMHRYIVSSLPGANGVTGDRFRMNLNASYQFPHDLIAEVFGNYNSATTIIQGKMPQSVTYTFAFRKQFWDKKASFGLTATNIFNEYIRQVTTINTANYSSYSVRELPYRSVGISFTYKFGKLEFKKNAEDDSYQNNPPVMGN